MKLKPLKGKYTRKVPAGGDLYTIDEFRANSNLLGPEDGIAYAVKASKEDISRTIRPEYPWTIPVDATHVSWYNK